MSHDSIVDDVRRWLAQELDESLQPFHGGVNVLSTCYSCHEVMAVTTTEDRTHPCCDPLPPNRSGPASLTIVALHYASWGWPVFPLRDRSKKPVTKHGLLDATTDLDRIARWWNRHPDNNIGLPTGHGFDVLDVDPANGGNESLQDLLRAKRIPTAHGVVDTASGGLHFYLEPTGKGNRAGFMPGLDYRGLGGYVVAPPSSLRRGSWSWMTTPSPMIKRE